MKKCFFGLSLVSALYAIGEHENDAKQPLLMICAVPEVAAPQYVEPGVVRTLKDRAPRLGDGTPLSVDTGCVVMTPKPQDPTVGFTRAYTRPDKEVEKEPNCWDMFVAAICTCIHGR